MKKTATLVLSFDVTISVWMLQTVPQLCIRIYVCMHCRIVSKHWHTNTHSPHCVFSVSSIQPWCWEWGAGQPKRVPSEVIMGSVWIREFLCCTQSWVCRDNIHGTSKWCERAKDIDGDTYTEYTDTQCAYAFFKSFEKKNQSLRSNPEKDNTNVAVIPNYSYFIYISDHIL